jgi:hypothetical protein
MAVPGPTSSFSATPLIPVGTSFRTIGSTELWREPGLGLTPRGVPVLAILPSDTEVTIVDSATDGNWYKVKVVGKGLTGFVAADAVRETSLLEAEEWQRIQKRRDVASLRSFVQKYPRGSHAQAARALLQAAAAVAPVPRTSGRLKPVASPDRPRSETLSTSRCTSIIERSQLGEEISDADRAILKNNCH